MSISIIENNNKFDQDFNIEFQTFKTHIDFFLPLFCSLDFAHSEYAIVIIYKNVI
jgi:hypothetical protein